MVGTVGMSAVAAAAWGAGGGRLEGGPAEEVLSSVAETSAGAQVVGGEATLWRRRGSPDQGKTSAAVAVAAAVGETAPAAAGVTAGAAAGVTVAVSAASGARDAGVEAASAAGAGAVTVVSAVDFAAVDIVGGYAGCLVDDECGEVPEAHWPSSVQGHVTVGLVQELGVATVFESGGDLEMEPEWDLGFGLAAQEAAEVLQPPREGWAWP